MESGSSQKPQDCPWLNPTWTLQQDSKGKEVIAMSFAVQGTPKPKGRPRFVVNKQTGFGHAYTPSTTRDWENAIGWQAKQAMLWSDATYGIADHYFPYSGRLSIVLRFNVVKPKSAPKSVEYPLKGADIDNFAKSVLDALQNVGLIWDDKTVTDLFAIKRWADDVHPEGVEIDITAWV